MVKIVRVGAIAGLFAMLIAAEPRADLWSLKPVRRPALPVVSNSNLTLGNPIDAFILAELAKHHLSFAPQADRVTLIRRATFDLLGLPPTPEEIDAFENDQAPGAWERLIDRLLASPRYGERWARHWLDVARFAESQGFERDKIRDNAWRYRDYVINALNADKPYDQFIREQIAGDVMPGATRDSIVATGFLVAGPFDEAGNSSASALLRARIREEELEDVISVVGQTFLGMTVNCARCHDHKFDPIPQRDYYRIKSVFEAVRQGDRTILTHREQQARNDQLAHLDREIARLQTEIAKLENSIRTKLTLAKPGEVSTAAPRPISRWTFDIDATDVVGKLNGTLHGSARIANGRLVLDGNGSYVETAPLPADLREKTLEAWVAPANLSQRGGGVMSVQTRDGNTFDAIVFGERQPSRWIAGSDFFRRTRDYDSLIESAGPHELVHIAITYSSDGTITAFRNGKPYFPSYRPEGEGASLRTYPAGVSQVLFGLRHRGAGNGFFAGEIEDARLYDRALTPSQLEASYRAGVTSVSRDQMIKSLTPEQRTKWDGLRDELSVLKSKRAAVPAVPISYAANVRPAPPTSVLGRGDVEKPGEIVAAGGLSAIHSLKPDFGLVPDAPESQRRLRFANWLADPANPLTARVMVNRLWHYHFGMGLVDTPNDFGANGGKPSHPQLLDWLASELVARGWSVKAMHRMILTSAAYRQSSQFNADAAAKDADDRMLWRFAPRRIEAEAVRDSMLAMSGRLNQQMGGPGFRPFKVTEFNSTFYELIDQDRPEFNRRTIYRIGVNSAKDPLLESFDCPEPSVKTPRRSVTTTPLQALGLMNDAFVLRQAELMANRVHIEVGLDASASARRAYRLALGRLPSETELRRAIAFIGENGLASFCWALFNCSEFLYVK
jgi:hypothetical protein